MINILMLEIISVLSFIFALLNIIFKFASLSQMFLLFLYSTALVMLVSYLQKKNSLYRVLSLLLFVPFLYFKSKPAFWFFLYLTALMSLYTYKSLGKGNYEHFSRRLKLSFTIISAITIFVVIFSNFRDFIMPGVAFAVLYLLSSIILVRSLRHMESGMDIDKLNNINLRYIVLIGILSIAMTIEPLRNMVGFLMSKVYSVIINGIIAIIYLPVRLFAFLIEKAIDWLTRGEFGDVELEVPEMSYGESGAKYAELIESNLVREVLLSILSLIAFIVVIYVAYKILSKIGDRNHEGLEYREEREYIKSTTRKKRRLFERYPKDLKGQVRYYYRKYLRKLNKNDIEIKSSHTSLDIKESSKNISKNASKIRSIYIKARYNGEDIKAEDVEMMKKAYKED